MEPGPEDPLSTVNSAVSGGPSPFEVERCAMPLRNEEGCYIPYRRARKRYEIYAYDPATSDHQISVADLQNFVNQVNSHPLMVQFMVCDCIQILLLVSLILSSCLFPICFIFLPYGIWMLLVGLAYLFSLVGLIWGACARAKYVQRD